MKRKLAVSLTKSMAAAFVVALGSSTNAFAGGAMKGAMGFEDMDQDGNGRISMQEAQQHKRLGADFKNADKDGDGSLDQTEFSAFEVSERQPGAKRPEVNP